RSSLTFSWESLAGAQNALNNLKHKISNLAVSGTSLTSSKKYQTEFLKFVNDDLDTPKALALAWEMLDDQNLTSSEKYVTLLNFDKIFGLNLDKIEQIEIPQTVLELAKQRKQFRESKNWQKSDEIRKEIEKLGFQVQDSDKDSEILPLN
ncbi:MAG: cysteine--tRNA ligase, partial [Candidatus Gribaldobacteria bacterium]|nr:cysteine--tRNA ligase [Candidatus Gribaldobacteria bacterium]